MSRGGRIALVLILLIVAVVAYFTTAYNDRTDQVLCDGLYAHAHNISDSTAIDVQVAPRERGRGAGTNAIPTCGELRRKAALKPR
jgi:hypothetical protein